MPITKNLAFIGLLLFASSCTSLQQSFENHVAVGMEKADVLEVVGGPQLTKRRNNQDVWQYFFYNGEQKTIREIHFKNNKVSYKGDPVQPKPGQSAKAVDSRNSKLLPSFGASPSEMQNLTPKQKQENLEKYIKEDEEAQAQRPSFKDL